MTAIRGLSNFVRRKSLEILLDGAVVTDQLLGNFNFRASLAEIDMDGGGLSEPTDPAYASIDFGSDAVGEMEHDPGFGGPSVISARIRNLAELTFPTATEGWGEIQYFLFSVNLTATPSVITPLAGGPIDSPVIVFSGETLVILQHDITWGYYRGS